MRRAPSAAAASLLRSAARPGRRAQPAPAQWQSLDWTELLIARGWLDRSELAAAGTRVQAEALELLSSALTYPVTAAAALVSLLPRTDGECSGYVVGARAEASLPAHVWSEARQLLGCEALSLSFCGPKAPVPSPIPNRDTHLQLLHPPKGQLFHESVLGQKLLNSTSTEADDATVDSRSHDAAIPDAFLCFNPGFGHPGWERAWEPTLRAMLNSRRPMLLSALGPHDAEHDQAFWRSHVHIGTNTHNFGMLQSPVYVPNPWASLVDTGASDGGPTSRANALVALISVEHGRDV